MHVPLRAAWKGPRVVVNTMISTQSRSLKALTFIIYMRVVAFACSHSHAAASCISEPPVCKDKTHIQAAFGIYAFIKRLHYAENRLNCERITGTIYPPTGIFVLTLYRYSFMHICFAFCLVVFSWFIFFVCFFKLKNLCEQLSVSHRLSSCINMFRLLTSNWCVF